MGSTKNWRELFFTAYKENGFIQSKIEKIYTIQMKLRAFFDFSDIIPTNLRLQNIEKDENGLRYYWISESHEAHCPYCNTLSTRPCAGDYVEKAVQDIPRDNLPVFHIIQLKRFECENESCETYRFVERFYELTEENARKTLRFKRYCMKRALGGGCLQAERDIRDEGGIVSNDSIGRYLKAAASGKIEENIVKNNVKVLAVDDINLRKGDKSSGCTVFVDGEKHKVLIVVKGTTKEATKRVIEKFSSSEFLSSDRAAGYSTAGAECGKTQVADRFHLIKNAQDAVKEALRTELPATIFIREGDGWVSAEGESPDEKLSFHVPDQIIEDRIRFARLTPTRATKYRNTLKILEFADQGFRTEEIAQKIGIPLKDVRALRRTAVATLEFVEEKINARLAAQTEKAEPNLERPGTNAKKTVAGTRIHSSKRSIVEPYKETVISLWKEGGNHRTIYPVIKEAGYTGSQNTIYQYLLKLSKEDPDGMVRETAQKSNTEAEDSDFDKKLAEERPEISLEKISRHEVYNAILKEAKTERKKEIKTERQESIVTKEKFSRPSDSPMSENVKELIYGPIKEEETPREEKVKKKREIENIKELGERYPITDFLREFLVDCYYVFDSSEVTQLDKFIIKYKGCGISSLEQYVKGLEADYEAVKNCLIYRCISNGPTEGCNSRIKMFHRRSTGRAGLDLLNAYIILSASGF